MLFLIVLILVVSCLTRSHPSSGSSLPPYEYPPLLRLFLLIITVTPVVVLVVAVLSAHPA